MAERGSSPVEPAFSGVPLAVYASVLGYLAEGVPLAESLDHAAIPAEDWPPAHASWSAHLAENAHDDPALLAACDEHRLAAAAHVDRPLPPLDVELRAWLDLFRAFTTADDPLDFLAKHHLGELDLFRLLALWQERTAADPALREASAQILAAPAGPVPAVEPKPPTLRPETRWPRREKAPPRATVADAPAPGKPRLAETSLSLDLSKIVLPFARSSGLSPVGVSTGAPTAPAKRSSLGETSLAVGARDGAALPFPQGPATPLQPATPLAPLTTIAAATPLVQAIPISSPPPLATEATPGLPAPPPLLAPKNPLAGTSPVVAVPATPPLPFAAAAGPSPMAIATPPSAQPPTTSAPSRLGTTRPATVEPARPALPFGAEGAPPAPPVIHRPPPELAGTMPLQGVIAPALPFGATAPPVPEPRLSLIAYATMHAEITANPSAAMATIARYGLTPATKPLEDAAWKAKFAAAPALRMEWMQALMEAGNRLRAK